MHTKLDIVILENFKVIFCSKVYWIRAKEVPRWVPDFWDEEEDEDQSEHGFKGKEHNTHDAASSGEETDAVEVPETMFEESIGQKGGHSEDPFEIYRF